MNNKSNLIINKSLLHNAFTLIELLIVIALIGIISGLSFTRFKTVYLNFQIRSAAHNLQTVMNYSRQLSIIERKIIMVNIDSSRHFYEVIVQNDKNQKKIYKINSDIKIKSTKKNIYFYPDGHIDQFYVDLSVSDKNSAFLFSKGGFGAIKIDFITK